MAERVYYDRDSDIVYINLYDHRLPPITADEHSWGLLESDATGALVGIEIWAVSELPSVEDSKPDG